MILVSEAGSIRASGSCEAITWSLLASSKIQDLAAIVGAGRDCACATLLQRTVKLVKMLLMEMRIRFMAAGVSLFIKLHQMASIFVKLPQE